MPALYPASAEAERPTGPAAAETSAPSLMCPRIRPFMPSSFMMNIMRSVLLPPICGPQLMPETSKGAGALQLPELVLQVATPLPCSPPTTKAPLISLGIMATHFASFRTSLGTPLSGEAVVMFCTVSVARESSELALLSFLSSSLACIRANAPKQEIRVVMKNLPRIFFRILNPPSYDLMSSIRWGGGGFTDNASVVSMVLGEFAAGGTVAS